MKTLFFAGFFFLSLTAAARPLTITSIVIDNGTLVSDSEIRNLLPLKEGDLFSETKWEQALSSLKKWGRFYEVRGEKKATPQGLELTLHLVEGLLISRIEVKGSYPFLSNRIRRLVALQPGDLFDDEEIAQQAIKIESFYQREVYEGTQVKVFTKKNEKKGTVEIQYQIQKGFRYRISAVTVKGNTVFPSGWFSSKINLLRPYRPRRFRQSLEKIREEYRNEGYVRARVRLSEMVQDPIQKKLHPILEVTEGDHLTVLFRGNRRMAIKSLRRILPIYTDGGYGTYEMEESVRAIIDLYHSRGFQEVEVLARGERVSRGERRIVFDIQEGPETRVKQVALEGNEKISDRKIRKNLHTKEETLFRNAPWQPEIIEEDFKNLTPILRSRGALEAKTIETRTTFSPLKDKATVTFEVEEGPITEIREIRIEGNQVFAENRLKKKLKMKEGDIYLEEKINRDKENLVRYYASRGYPYVHVEPELQGSGAETTLIYHIQEGDFVRIGEILIIGNQRTRRRSIESALLLKKGDLFNYRKLIDSESSLRRLGAFRSVSIETIGLLEKEPIVHLKIRVEESESVILDLAAAFDTDDQFTGSTTLNHVNLFGFAKRANLKLTGGRDIQKGELNFIDPHSLGYNLEAILTGLAEMEQRPSFDDLDVGGSVSLLREITPQLNLLTKYQLIRTYFRNVLDPTEESEQDHTTSKVSFSASYDRRDSFADPTRGFATVGGVDLSTKIAGSGFNFIQPKAQFAHYVSFGGRWTLLNFIRGEGIDIIGDDVLTRDQRLFLGGDYTVRGFNQDAVGPVGANTRPFGGLILLLHTAELQTRLFKNFKSALFVDSGSITNRLGDVSLASIRHGGGLGLRYITPVGPIRLDYGFKLDRQTGEDLSRLHFTFGYAF